MGTAWRWRQAPRCTLPAVAGDTVQGTSKKKVIQLEDILSKSVGTGKSTSICEK